MFYNLIEKVKKYINFNSKLICVFNIICKRMYILNTKQFTKIVGMNWKNQNKKRVSMILQNLKNHSIKFVSLYTTSNQNNQRIVLIYTNFKKNLK